MNKIKTLLSKVPAPLLPVLAAAASLVAGVAVAIMLDYLLFRIGLPGKPFIYVSF